MDNKTLTVAEYKAQANALDKVSGALDALGADEIFEATRNALHDTCQKLGDGLAFALAALAREADARKNEHVGKGASIGYYADDIWEALGRYAYHNGDDAGTGHLTSARYAVEKVIAALTPELTPAEIAEARAQETYKEALEDGLSDHEAREMAWPSEPVLDVAVGPAVDEAPATVTGRRVGTPPLQAIKPAPADYDEAMVQSSGGITEHEREQAPS